ncbi:hypothetical protein BKA67DRAFT_536282 [Truncatella angustata]|uniref:Uncharacterized protein n=1 Tax=Truncatella angustata TaxID=152316 RepID=A0A9P8ZW05_9PEZI|nr:uncharacterized protein BKA67DRAFT_536282 [Truncatella angustata]KAH6652546.1 hypothetical protein BKA67DRAFT_536282 [Truncatella angustata]KAH8200162.1 hypothetical protein TruAng_005674 [Truncatella angustata]
MRTQIGEDLGREISRLRTLLKAFRSELAVLAVKIQDTELHILLLTAEVQHQKGPERATKHRTARQEEAAMMGANQRRRMAIEKEEILKERQATRGAQNSAVGARKEAEHAEQYARDVEHAKHAACQHMSWRD